jgi:hypothetical protein
MVFNEKENAGTKDNDHLHVLTQQVISGTNDNKFQGECLKEARSTILKL